MKELLSKLSSYNLFNYLFPGVISVLMLKEFAGYDVVQESLVFGAFLYYFVGMVVSRFGSLVIEPILTKSSFVKFADYASFVIASSKDEKVDMFSEINNMYRTLISAIVLVIGGRVYHELADLLNISKTFSMSLLLIALILLFVLSYRKQTKYVVKRVEVNTKKNVV